MKGSRLEFFHWSVSRLLTYFGIRRLIPLLQESLS